MLKVGDKIKFLIDKDDNFCMSISEGEIFEVVSVNKDLTILQDSEGNERYFTPHDHFIEGEDYEVINV